MTLLVDFVIGVGGLKHVVKVGQRFLAKGLGCCLKGFQGVLTEFEQGVLGPLHSTQDRVLDLFINPDEGGVESVCDVPKDAGEHVLPETVAGGVGQGAGPTGSVGKPEGFDAA